MKKFTKIFSRRQGRETQNGVGTVYVSSPDFHQLTSRRHVHAADAITSKRPRRPGAGSRIIADGSDKDGGENKGANREAGDHDKDVKRAQVCDTCAAIDFPRLLDWHPGDPRPWVPLLHTLADSECPFCTFFQAMLGAESDDQTGKFTPYLRIRQAFERLGGVRERHVLGREVLVEVTTRSKLLPWGYIVKAADDEAAVEGYSDGTPMIRGRSVPPLLDPKVPKTWIDFCDKNHAEESCGATRTVIEGLRLVDCEARRVVSVEDLDRENLQYVTLSYVNGEARDGSLDGESGLPDKISRLFEDAIAFTQTLGFRYLWIDRYCFTSLEPTQRRRQLDVMGDIYAGSALTMIVAAGESAEDGIPGISEPREEQLSIKTQKGIFTTTLLRPDIEVGRSKWASRGWTFQEGLLSRRRLVFTPSQVYFQCQCLHCHESISLPLKSATGVNLGRVFPEASAMSQPGHIQKQIGAYMPKAFTDSYDRLDAFRGILQRYSQMDLAVDHFLGLPLFHPGDFKIAKVVSQTDRLAVALGWIPNRVTSFQGHVDPYFLDDTFPSWTWLAWQLRPGQGTLNHSFHFNLVGETSPLLSGVTAPPKTEISVGFEDGLVVSWEIDGEAIARKTERITFLRLETFCFELKVRKDDDSVTLVDSSLGRASRDLVEAWFRSSSAAASTDTDGGTDVAPPSIWDHELVGVLLSGRNWTDDEAQSVATVLVARRRGWTPDGAWVRLGVLSIAYEAFVMEGETSVVMKGIEVDAGGKRNLKVQSREIDLY